MKEQDFAVQFLAYASGGFFCSCLIPQLRLIWKNMSASDVSISWTLLYIMGLILQITYLALMGGLIWISVAPELSMAVFLLFSKFYLDNYNQRSSNKVYLEAPREENDDMDNNETIASSTVSPGMINRGYHGKFDYQGIFIRENDLSTFQSWFMKVCESHLTANKIPVIRKRCISNSSENPGFHGFFLLPGGHISIHHDSHMGAFNVDVFTSEDSWEVTKKLAMEIHEEMTKRFPARPGIPRPQVNQSRRCAVRMVGGGGGGGGGGGMDTMKSTLSSTISNPPVLH